MKVYVATKFSNGPIARQFMRTLRGENYVVTYDWTEPENQAHPSPVIAEKDLAGVTEADVLVLLCVPAMQGAWVELGAALALRKPVIMLESETAFVPPVFVHHPLITHVLTMRDVAAVLRTMRKEANDRAADREP